MVIVLHGRFMEVMVYWKFFCLIRLWECVMAIALNRRPMGVM